MLSDLCLFQPTEARCAKGLITPWSSFVQLGVQGAYNSNILCDAPFGAELHDAAPQQLAKSPLFDFLGSPHQSSLAIHNANFSGHRHLRRCQHRCKEPARIPSPRWLLGSSSIARPWKQKPKTSRFFDHLRWRSGTTEKDEPTYLSLRPIDARYVLFQHYSSPLFRRFAKLSI